ncbi:uncharacterized protein Eint_070790 [Encephalitozoon intestinalis ATCC 50506]|uniref:Uncharacterized protein n=1 Tax=Encephalitozoon intestinalis (strain ATCC 50506) TaxID=876142 RepID=E0S808_ENCIT|nr:uncharacterized protein Eint_070790 [Encephalitozoon intestinalis ATCC 50506]ADM11843.1 hypothetical protein Eint_070790 [Encephalitozoon intestinalis ATCC 50506]UTX45593.1 hypothetical protein GPK93_07g11570 [Encephalitozoon intestinalis]
MEGNKGREEEGKELFDEECSSEFLPIDFYDKSRRPRDDQGIEFVVTKNGFPEGTRGVCFEGVVDGLEFENRKMEAEIEGLSKKERRIEKENAALKDVLLGLLSKLSS